MNLLPENTYRRFLLGMANEQEEADVEESIITGSADASRLQRLGEDLHRLEDELIDDHLLGALSQEQEDGFINHFLVTEDRRKRTEFAESLILYARSQAEYPPTTAHAPYPIDTRRGNDSWRRGANIWKGAALAATAASVLLAAALVHVRTRLSQQIQIAASNQSELARLQAVLTSASPAENTLRSPEAARGVEEVNKPSAVTTPDPHPEAVQTAFLTLPAITRDARNVPRLRLRSNVRVVRIEFIIEPLFATTQYSLAIVSSEGRHLWTSSLSRPKLASSAPARIAVPASIFSQGPYHLQVQDENDPQSFKDYSFYVSRS
ncbi:hypothetical protein [Granulicella sibirica]|uniref:Uncharacterized protein n=1 Tax=Granulicella sibirica TaxID=2479048 RepID=A0A4Q0SXB8_9BACT|nr:hypothetical protein [Granulicella sibirica]RXH54238.1 hypothetical protein GRAN_4889 [Granulicella sibirica]